MTKNARANILGVGIHAVDMAQAVSTIETAILNNRKGYVCLTGVHGVMEACRDRGFREILEGALLVAPDGMPTVWVGKAQGFQGMRRVYGPDLMLEICRRSAATQMTHYLYGGKNGVVKRLHRNLEERYPGIRIVGTYTPPFRALSENEERELQKEIARLHPDIIWVGLSTPKQERFAAANLGRLDCRLMIGVGAAFDIHAGERSDAPSWMKQAGLQWLHRLCQEPGRLGKRYLLNNPAFLYRIALQLSGLRKYKLPGAEKTLDDGDKTSRRVDSTADISNDKPSGTRARSGPSRSALAASDTPPL